MDETTAETGAPGTPPEGTGATDPPGTLEAEGLREGDQAPLPAFHRRLTDVFFNPARLGEALREHPAWAMAMLVGVVLVALQLGLIPADIWTEIRRQTMLRAGRPMPETPERLQALLRWSAPLFGSIGVMLLEFIMAGVVTVVFAFVMGDEGSYRQYLAVLSHAWIIPGVVELLMLPMKIAQKNPQMTVSLGTFFFFLPEGYFLKVLTMMSLSQIWAWIVVAAGVHAIDRKRSFATAATVLLALNLVIAMIIAIFTPPLS